MGTKTVDLRGLTEDLTQTVVEDHAFVARFMHAEILRFRTVVFSDLLASELRITEAIDAFGEENQVRTSGTATDASLIMFRTICLSLQLNVLICYAVRVTLGMIVCCSIGSANFSSLSTSVWFRLFELGRQFSLFLSLMAGYLHFCSIFSVD